MVIKSQLLTQLVVVSIVKARFRSKSKRLSHSHKYRLVGTHLSKTLSRHSKTRILSMSLRSTKVLITQWISLRSRRKRNYYSSRYSSWKESRCLISLTGLKVAGDPGRALKIGWEHRTFSPTDRLLRMILKMKSKTSHWLNDQEEDSQGIIKIWKPLTLRVHLNTSQGNRFLIKIKKDKAEILDPVHKTLSIIPRSSFSFRDKI